MQENVYHTNYQLEDTYWWFVARKKIIKKILSLHVPKGSSVLDVGCGTGGFASSLLGDYEVYGTDTSPLALEYSRKRGVKNLFLGTLSDLRENGAPKATAATMLDVLEHIDDSMSALSDLYAILPKGGVLVITVPAYQSLWSQHDLIHKHFRRYTKKTLNAALRQTGFTIDYSTYFNTLLFLPAWLKRLVDKLTGADKHKDSPIDEVPEGINKLFTKVFGFESNLLPAIKFPFGLSILSVAYKK